MIEMTIVKIGRKESDKCMEFEFDYPMDAFVFYSQAKNSYRENDMVIAMEEEEEEENE